MRRTQLITTAALVAACAVPATAAAQGQDLRSPDARDAASAAQEQAYQDLRSPDTRDAARGSETRQYSDLRSPDARDAGRPGTNPGYTDLRSPDARDAGRPGTNPGYTDLRSPDARDAGRTPVELPTPVVEIREVPGSGFDWGDAGIGAAGMLALFSIAAGVALTASGRRRRRGFQMPAH